MASWAKKINKAVGSDLDADEELQDGVFLQPAGTTGAAVSRGVGGLVGAVIADKVNKNKAESVGHELVSDRGLAAEFPKQPVVLGLTHRRLLVWSHSQLSGKPKELQTTLPIDQISGISVEKQKATYEVTLSFTDGTGLLLEAPKIQNKPEAFAESFSRIKG